MEVTEEDNSHSSESHNSLNSDLPYQPDYTCFLSKITQELQTHFTRNNGEDNYCNNIYEDIYMTPQSGSYSYYKDLLTMAQNKNNTSEVIGTTSESSANEGTRTVIAESCSWACSGYSNPSAGMGPLQELFKVLEHPRQDFPIQPPSDPSSNRNVESYFQEGFEIANLPTAGMYNEIEDGFSAFSDIFRLTTETFPMEFLPINPIEF